MASSRNSSSKYTKANNKEAIGYGNPGSTSSPGTIRSSHVSDVTGTSQGFGGGSERTYGMSSGSSSSGIPSSSTRGYRQPRSGTGYGVGSLGSRSSSGNSSTGTSGDSRGNPPNYWDTMGKDETTYRLNMAKLGLSHLAVFQPNGSRSSRRSRGQPSSNNTGSSGSSYGSSSSSTGSGIVSSTSWNSDESSSYGSSSFGSSSGGSSSFGSYGDSSSNSYSDTSGLYGDGGGGFM